MTIEQRPELNRFVDPSIPLTWNWRWRQLKMTLPIWCFALAWLIEIWLFKAWLASKLALDGLAILLGAWLVMILFTFGMAEIQTRIQQRSKRIIQFKDNKIIVKPAKSGLVLWKRVAKFQFEPIPEMQGMTKLKLFLHGRPNEKMAGRTFWAMVLENPSQVQELVRYLQTKRTESPIGYEIEILERPALEPSVPFPFIGMSLYMGGMFLLLHGGPMLLGLLNHDHHDSDGDSKFTPEERAKLHQFLARHFSNKEELRHFFLTLSICLIVAGIALLVSGWWLMNRKPQIVRASGST